MFIDLIWQKVPVQYAEMYHPRKTEQNQTPALWVHIYVMKNASSVFSRRGAHLELTLFLSASRISGHGSWEHPSVIPQKVVFVFKVFFLKLVGPCGSPISTAHRKQ